jgi:hypothetical protein
MPSILLITDVLPSSKHTAGIVLHQFFAQIPLNYELLTYCVHSDSLPSYEVSERINGKMRWSRKPSELWLLPGFLKSMFEKISERDTRNISKDINEQISRIKPDLVFLVLQGQTMFRIGLELFKAGVQFSTFHWDPLSWWLHHNKSPNQNLQLLDKIRPALNSGGVHILPNSSFAKYLGLASDNYVVLNLAHEKVERNREEMDNILRVCFSGQAYAAKEIEFFIKTLDSVAWKVDGFTVELHVFGNSYFGTCPQIFYHGWIEPKNLIDRISIYDCGLLPYPSEKAFEEVSKYSFPSKLSTYVAANLPVIYLGPKTNPFSEKQKKSIFLVEVNDRERLLSGLKIMKCNSEEYLQGTQELFDSEFSYSAQTSVVRSYFELQGKVFTEISTSVMIPPNRNSRHGQQFRYPAQSLTLSHHFNKIHFVLIRFWRNLPNSLRNRLRILFIKFKRFLGASIGLLSFLLSRKIS